MASGTIPFEQYPYFQSIDSAANLNNYKTPGMYRWAYAPTNAPTYGIGSGWTNSQMEVRANSDNSFVTQIVMYNPGSDSRYPNVKRVWTGSAWGNWYPIVDQGEDISSHITPETGVAINRARRIGNLVIINLTAPKVTSANTQISLATIDSGYRPASGLSYTGTITFASTSDFGYGVIWAAGTGSIAMMYSKTTSYGLYCTIVYYIG